MSTPPGFDSSGRQPHGRFGSTAADGWARGLSRCGLDLNSALDRHIGSRELQDLGIRLALGHAPAYR